MLTLCFLESLVVFVPSDGALLNYLKNEVHGRKSKFWHRILLEETFARKVLLGSMKIMGQMETLRPQWTFHLHTDYSQVDSILLGNTMIHILNEVMSVDKADLKEAILILESPRLPGTGYNTVKSERKRERHLSLARRIAPSKTLSTQVHIAIVALIIEHGKDIAIALF